MSAAAAQKVIGLVKLPTIFPEKEALRPQICLYTEAEFIESVKDFKAALVHFQPYEQTVAYVHIQQT